MKTTSKQQLYDRLIEDSKSISKYLSMFQQVGKSKPIIGVLSTGKYKNYNLGFEIQLTNNNLQLSGGDFNVIVSIETVRLIRLAFSKATSLQGAVLCTSKNDEGRWTISVQLRIDRYNKLSKENRKESLLKCVCTLAYLGWCTELYDECGSLETLSLSNYRIISILTDSYEPYWGENTSDDNLFDLFNLPYPEIRLPNILNDSSCFFI